MNFRHELKHEINYSDMLALRSRLSAVAKPDQNGTGGRYNIRSLYFDNINDKALREKINGVNKREKFRIRYYNNDTSYIVLEKKSKVNGLCAKSSMPISAEQAAGILQGDFSAFGKAKDNLAAELCFKMKTQGLRPKTIVDYTRDAFYYPAGNTRVTIDWNIRTGLTCTDFLNPSCVTIAAGDAPLILEVKWDEFLPEVIRDIIQLDGKHTSAFSKYAACRIYG